MKKRLEKKLKFLLSLLIIIVLLPLLVTISMQNMDLESLTTTNVTGTGVVDDEKVLKIVAKEININSDRETLKAQCVIARTNLCRAIESKTTEPEGLTTEEMQALWGEEYETLYQKLLDCVSETKNKVLLWKNDYIYAAYHAVSSGRTRKMSDVYKEADMPYLLDVECHEDTTAKGYLAVSYLKKSDFFKTCGAVFPETEIKELSEIIIKERDASDYVMTMAAGGKICSGEEFRNAFSLPSSCFTLTDLGEQIRIVTRGVGHGLGMSQHMAGILAADGKNYKEILEYFYPGTQIETKEKSES